MIATRMVLKRPSLKRYQIYYFVCRYALEHNGVTPSFAEIGRQFYVSPDTIRTHVLWLTVEGLLRVEERQIIVEDSDWIPPETFQG